MAWDRYVLGENDENDEKGYGFGTPTSNLIDVMGLVLWLQLWGMQAGGT